MTVLRGASGGKRCCNAVFCDIDILRSSPKTTPCANDLALRNKKFELMMSYE